MGRPKINSNATKFGRFLDERGIDFATAALALGITRQYANLLAVGSTQPGRALMFKIEAWARSRGGSVPADAESWEVNRLEVKKARLKNDARIALAVEEKITTSEKLRATRRAKRIAEEESRLTYCRAVLQRASQKRRAARSASAMQRASARVSYWEERVKMLERKIAGLKAS